MFALKKILHSTFALLLLTAVSPCGYAQTKQIKKSENAHSVTIGFQTGRELLFNSTALLHSKQNKIHYGISKSLVLRKSLNNHFKVETGLKYAELPCRINTAVAQEKINYSIKTDDISLPLTIQYHFLSKKCRLHPFCGAGLQCGFFDSKNALSPSTIRMDAITPYYIHQADTKYITILFTQGVTFEVNTKIEISQTFHFLPENANNIFGVNVGVGFNIP